MVSRAFPGFKILWFWELKFAREWSFCKFSSQKNNNFLTSVNSLRNKEHSWYTLECCSYGSRDYRSRIQAGWCFHLPARSWMTQEYLPFSSFDSLTVKDIYKDRGCIGLRGPGKVFASFFWPPARMLPRFSDWGRGGWTCLPSCLCRYTHCCLYWRPVLSSGDVRFHHLPP